MSGPICFPWPRSLPKLAKTGSSNAWRRSLKSFEKLAKPLYSAPNLAGKRLAFKFEDKQSIELIPEIMRPVPPQKIDNPEIEPEIRRSKIEPLWFDGPALPSWMTSWYDNWMGQPEKSHTVALWMLVCIALLSMEWLTVQAAEAGVTVIYDPGRTS